jgi:hypothetical protein
MGVYPKPFLDRSRETIAAIQERVVGGVKGGTIEHAEVAPKPKVQSPQAAH